MAWPALPAGRARHAPPGRCHPPPTPRPLAELERLHGALRAHHQGLLPRAHGPDRRGLAASRRPRVRRARPPRTESPGARQAPDPAAVDGTATPWSRPVPPAARWDVARRLSVSSVIHARPSTPRSSLNVTKTAAVIIDSGPQNTVRFGAGPLRFGSQVVARRIDVFGSFRAVMAGRIGTWVARDCHIRASFWTVRRWDRYRSGSSHAPAPSEGTNAV